jgi:hypothetical protein
VHAYAAAGERAALQDDGARFPAGLGKITNRVSPPVSPAIWGTGAIALPFESAQFDFAGVPLACAPPAELRGSQVREIVENASPSPAQRALFGPEQLELPFQQARRARFKLRDALRRVSPLRPSRCGRVRIAPVLEILRGDDGRAHWSGLLTCGSVWSCPTCSAAIRTERAREVQDAVEAHGQDRTYLLSLTLRHAKRDDLRALRAAVAVAWRRMQTGAPWRRFRERVGFVGSIRALEVTHGKNGWHPHLHVLLLVDDVGALDADREWLQLRWRAAVVRELGAQHAPDLGTGCDLRPCHEASYVAKLGLELAMDQTKRARGGRNPWQIARDFARTRRPRDGALWRAYADGLAGARMLTWSKGLRGELRSDDDVARDPGDLERERAQRRYAVIAGADWDAIRHVPRVGALLLVAAERGEDVRAIVARLKGTHARKEDDRHERDRGPPHPDYA